jgi:hypothetical protein
VLKLLLVLLVMGVAIYVAIRMMQGPGRTPARRRPTGPPPRPLAPDDAPDFLRDLDRKRHREEDSG